MEIVDIEEMSNLSLEHDATLARHRRCSAHTLNLLATKDVDSVPGWSKGPRASFTQVSEQFEIPGSFR